MLFLLHTERSLVKITKRIAKITIPFRKATAKKKNYFTSQEF